MSDTETLQPPTAVTLDEQVLRQLFPNAPASLDVPRDVRSVFAARLRELRASHGSVAYAVIGLALAAAALALVLGEPVAAMVVVGLLVAAIVGVGLWQHASAADDFFDRYAAARGLVHVEDASAHAGVPLLSKGDERKWPRVLGGNILGQDARLAHYTYTEVSRDSEGNESRTDYDFTILCMHLPPQVAARFAGVYLAPRSLSFGALQDKLAHDRKVELESTAFTRRYSLRVVDEQDDIALFELLSTPFVQRLASDLQVYWQQRGSDIVFWRRKHECEAADLDRFCLDASHVLQRYLEEWR